jgi:hypothetical protein
MQRETSVCPKIPVKLAKDPIIVAPLIAKPSSEFLVVFDFHVSADLGDVFIAVQAVHLLV